jgi:hypothetical protein
LFENVLSGQTGAEEVYSVAMHRLEQAPAGMVDTSDALQVD